LGFQLSIARGVVRGREGRRERERESYRSGGAVGLIISAPQTEERSEEKIRRGTLIRGGMAGILVSP
jgi:hypothetical protein